jgi:hypothetical protein
LSGVVLVFDGVAPAVYGIAWTVIEAALQTGRASFSDAWLAGQVSYTETTGVSSGVFDLASTRGAEAFLVYLVDRRFR